MYIPSRYTAGIYLLTGQPINKQTTKVDLGTEQTINKQANLPNSYPTAKQKQKEKSTSQRTAHKPGIDPGDYPTHVYLFPNLIQSYSLLNHTLYPLPTHPPSLPTRRHCFLLSLLPYRHPKTTRQSHALNAQNL